MHIDATAAIVSSRLVIIVGVRSDCVCLYTLQIYDISLKLQVHLSLFLLPFLLI